MALLVASSPHRFFRNGTVSWFLCLAGIASLSIYHKYFVYLAFIMMLSSIAVKIFAWYYNSKRQTAAKINWIFEWPAAFSQSLSPSNLDKILPTNLPKALKFLGYFSFALLALSAAIPRRRYDQWNYHLSVPKWIMDLGGLPDEIFNDHLYFTGSYEYFSALFRIFSSHDIFIQSATSAMTFLLVAGLSSFSLVYFLSSHFKFNEPKDRWLLFLGFFLLAALSPWDRECLYSAKPDYLLIPLTITVVGLLSWLLEPSRKSSAFQAVESKDSVFQSMHLSFVLGFLLTAGVAIKITWIHLALACFLGSILFLMVTGSKHRIIWTRLFFGLMSGALIAIPVLAKNYYYFDDPLYPAATPGFLSRYRLAFVDYYWLHNSSPARSLKQFLFFFLSLPKVLLINYGFLFLALGISAVPSWRSLKTKIPGKTFLSFLNRPSLYILSIYILLWPLLHQVEIFPRFVIPIVAILVWEIAYHTIDTKRLYLAAFFLLITQANPNILLRDIFRAMASQDKFYLTTSEGEALLMAKQIKAEERAREEGLGGLSEVPGFAKEIPKNNQILTNSTVSYFFDAPTWCLCTYPLRAYLEKKGVHMTDREWKAPFSEQVISEIIEKVGAKYYVHLKNDYCKRPEMLDYMNKYGIKVAGENLIFKLGN